MRETPPTACILALKPSDTLSVIALETNEVSVANRLINSPDFSLSKKAISCEITDRNVLLRSR